MSKKSVMNLGLVREDFSFEAAKTLSSLFDQPDFSDVTLVCEDEKQILAHKVILASGSRFFENILSLNPHPRPLLYLRVKFSDLEAIVRFVYTGQCKVGQDELERFLEIAKSLEIDGLANDEDIKVTKLSNHDDFENANDEANARVISESGAAFENQNFDENEKSDIEGACANNIHEKNKSITREEETDNLNQIKAEPKGKTEKDVSLSCNECKQSFPTQSHLTEHMSKDHLSYGYQMFSSAKSLTSHKLVQNAKKANPGLHYPENEEQLTFFGSGQKETIAFDKNFYSFG